MVERAYKWAERRFKKVLGHIFDNYPNNHHSDMLNLAINVDKENADHCGGAFYPEENEIIINKYGVPITFDDRELRVLNFFKDKKRFRHFIVHELIHYAFTEYEYADNKDEPIGWTVGLCTKENTTDHVEKDFYKKWTVDEWLDEVLTERLAMHISGWHKTGTMLYDKNISDCDKHIFEKVKQKLTVGPVELENIVDALFHHDKNVFLDEG